MSPFIPKLPGKGGRLSSANRAYTAAHFRLELDQKKQVGFVRSVEGGGIKTDVMDFRAGDQRSVFRQLAKPKYEDVKIQVGMAMSAIFYEWISSFFNGNVVRKSGAILAADFHYNERARREFYHALVSEVSIPKLDGSDRSAAFMGVTLVPERMEFKPGSQQPLEAGALGADKQKLWTAANFEFTVDGMDQACRRVTRVDGFTIKQQILEYPAGDHRDTIRVPGILEIPNISFALPESDAQPFLDRLQKHTVVGSHRELTTGGIRFLDHGGETLCVINLEGLDVFSIAPDKLDSTSKELKLVKVEMTCEKMTFEYGDAAEAAWNNRPKVGDFLPF